MMICTPEEDITCDYVKISSCTKVLHKKCEDFGGTKQERNCMTIHTRKPIQKQITRDIVVCGGNFDKAYKDTKINNGGL